MEQQFSKNPEWEEIFIASPETRDPFSDSDFVTGSYSVSEIQDLFSSEEIIPSTELSKLKEEMVTLLKDKRTHFHPEDHIVTDLLGNIHLKAGHSEKLGIFPFFTKSIEDEKKLLELATQTVEEFKLKFSPDEELLEILTKILLYWNRLGDLVLVAGRFKEKKVLPLKFQIFFILVGIHENPLDNIIVSGEETNVINILYKFKFLQLSKSEKNKLYDLVLNKQRPELTGVVFHLYSDTYKGLRNIHPIHQRILKKFHELNQEEKKEFINSYEETGKYFQTYFLLKKALSKKELKEWFQRIKKMNGKAKPDSEKCFPGFNEKEDILKKYKFLQQENETHSLSPFEILLLLGTNVSLNLKSDIQESFQSFPNSYSANRAFAVLNYYESDYRNFLLYIDKAGSLKHHSECVYLKAMSFLETGHKEEAKTILFALQNKFPNAEVIKETLRNN
ncbi:MAG: hypothetical protein SFU98_20165 [Leptospiraceae bacterium]|nr:hypothetical protein [Leptospiraceae bacterium]